MLKLTSPAYKDGRIELRYGNLGDPENMKYGIPQNSIPLRWEGEPEGTKSYAIVFIDYDNAKDEGFPFIHWMVAGIPEDVHELAEGASRNGACYTQGHNSWSIAFGPYEEIPDDYALHFGGPAPETEHEYEMWLYALDYDPQLENGFWFNDLRRAIEGHTLDETVLKGLYH